MIKNLIYLSILSNILLSFPGVFEGRLFQFLLIVSVNTFAFLLWLLKYHKIYRKTYLSFPVSIYLFVILISIIPSIINDTSITNWLYMFSVFSYLLLYFPIVSVFKSDKDIKILLKMYIITFVIVSSIIITLHLLLGNKYGIFGELGVDRATGPIWSSIILFSLILFKNNIFNKYISIILFIMLVFTETLALKRAPILIILLGIILVTSIYIIKMKKGYKLFYILVITLISLSFFTIMKRSIDVNLKKYNIVEGYSKRLGEGYVERSFGIRFMQYKYAFQGFEQSPIYGIGLGKEYYLGGIGRVHSLYIYILLHLGLVGIIVLFYLIIKLILNELKLLKLFKYNRFLYSLTLSITVSNIAFWGFSVFSLRSLYHESWMFIALSAGIVTALSDRLKNTSVHN